MNPQGAQLLDAVVAGYHAGRPRGVTSVCSAHPLVLEAAFLHAQETTGPVLVEATSNQVDQDGGYTGMTPEDFVRLCRLVAERVGLPFDRVVLGGDHLGVNRWRSMPADEAMARADVLVAAYVQAGFTKIHLDCSYACADDVAPLTDEIVAARAARLCAVAEQAADDPRLIRYVVGTEVPVPGGADHAIESLSPTPAPSARHTLQAHRAAFAAAGVGAAWERVMALVVQPGVEFDHASVVDYDRYRTGDLRDVLKDQPHLVFEAHSTDYQTPGGLRALVEDGWGVLKVGPWLTFALREAMFALASIEAQIVPGLDRSRLREVIETMMLADPSWWEPYYRGTAQQQAYARVWSYSDRLRYYWGYPKVVAAVETLFRNLDRTGIPMSLLSAHLPYQHDRVRAGLLNLAARDLVIDRVRDVLRIYEVATRA